MTEHSQSTTTLNTLIATLLDSIEGYQNSAENVDDQQLRQRFQARASERQQAVSTLQAAVGRLGGNPEDDSTLLGGAHRVFVNLKAAVTGRDDQAIINEVERGEDYLKGKFQAALKEDNLDSEARSAIQQAWTSVQAGHDEMSRLKHEWQGSNRGSGTTGSSTSGSAAGTAGTAGGAGYGSSTTPASAQQEYAAESGNSASGETFVGGDTAGTPQRPLTGTDTYQQQAGGYPGTIGSETGTTNP
jgi:uncharacterized protein (TIGR02284 family)